MKDYKEIPGFPGYKVNKQGVVRGPNEGIIKPNGSTNQLYVSLKDTRGNRKRLRLHRVVLSTWSPLPNSDAINVKRNKPGSYNLEDLEWDIANKEALTIYKVITTLKSKDPIYKDKSLHEYMKHFHKVMSGTRSTTKQPVVQNTTIVQNNTMGKQTNKWKDLVETTLPPISADKYITEDIE